MYTLDPAIYMYIEGLFVSLYILIYDLAQRGSKSMS